MQGIERTPPSSSAAKTVTAAGAEAKAKAVVEAELVKPKLQCQILAGLYQM
jgi:hypothetical protein